MLLVRFLMSVRNCFRRCWKDWPIFDWNMFPLPITVSISQEFFCSRWVYGSSQMAHGLCEVPSMKVLTRGMMKEHWWGSMTWVSSWPSIPCYAGHRPLVTKLTCLPCNICPIRCSSIFSNSHGADFAESSDLEWSRYGLGPPCEKSVMTHDLVTFI